MAVISKTCTKCKIDRGSSEFTKDVSNKDKLHSWCKACCKIRSRQYRFRRREVDLKYRYNLTLEQYNKIYVEQLGLCAMCHVPFGSETPQVDHCHKTGKVRGILHGLCNSIMGHADDDIQLLQLAIEYLQKYK